MCRLELDRFATERQTLLAGFSTECTTLKVEAYPSKVVEPNDPVARSGLQRLEGDLSNDTAHRPLGVNRHRAIEGWVVDKMGHVQIIGAAWVEQEGRSAYGRVACSKR